MNTNSPKQHKMEDELREDLFEEELTEEDLEGDLTESLSSLNYNDRPDGYGFGESESRDSKRAYEKDAKLTNHCIDMGEGYRSHKGEPFTRDENGQRNQYGPVDQYVFRDAHLYLRGDRKEKEKQKKEKEKE